jgi:transposase IS66 family protein
MSPPVDIESLSNADLKDLVIQLLGRVAELERTVAQQRDEIARLKGGKGRPDIKPSKPSGMEQASGRAAGKPGDGRRRGRGAKNAELAINEERIVTAGSMPPGSRFKGYTNFMVQDLVLRPHVIRFRCERWLRSDGSTLTAPLPSSLSGHFGPGLQRFVLAQYHQGQITVPRLLEQLRALGVAISKRQLMRLLIADKEPFLAEARDVLRAGLASAAWISVDDTGARHQGGNATCTQVGNEHFAWFATTGSKSRLNFLELLRAGHTDYVVNAEALAYMRGRALPQHAIARLADHPDKHFADEHAWTSHLQRLGFHDLKHSLDPPRLATEGALWGAVRAHGLLPDTVILSDDAGQFEVARHALCWVHAERLVHKLDTFCDLHRKAQKHVRSLIWRFYSDLHAYKRQPSRRRKAQLRARFDRIFKRRTGFAMLDRLLARLHANKAELLTVLDRPEIPLHTNGSENDIRCQVIRRKISGGTRSQAGRACRDTFLGLMKTCQKLRLSFWDYLGDRLGVTEASHVQYLPNLVSSRCASN